jgi:diguanylate cyclase (GGDEF)-like protein
MRHHFRLELEDMWVGKLAYEREGINYSLTGEPITVQIYWRVVPGYEESFARVLVALEDITARKAAEKSLATSEARLRGLFENSPISLWEEDFSGVKQHLDRLRAQGIKDVSAYLEKHPEFVDECEQRIKVLDINRKTLEMFGAHSKDELIENLGSIFRDEMRKHFHDELVDIWSGKLAYDREGINYSLAGKAIDVQIYWRVVPGFESTLERVMVALEDITARKIAEEYLKYLGTHDVMTKTYNRGYFEEELARLKDSRRYPVSIFVADLNNLKITNDSQGHSAGDGLIRRAAEVLQACFRIEDMVARIGGDEFAVVVAEMDEVAAQIALVRIRKMVEMNNNFYLGPVLSLSIGAATGNKDVDLLEVFREADDQMYADKRRSRTNAQ